MPPRTRTTTDQASHEHDDLNGAHLNGQTTPRDPAATSITVQLPSFGNLGAKRLLWYGGLGALATIGILDWPVALVVGAGTLIAARSRHNPTPAAPTTPRSQN